MCSALRRNVGLLQRNCRYAETSYSCTWKPTAVHYSAWVHSSVVRAADCRSAGPWFKSGCALFVESRCDRRPQVQVTPPRTWRTSSPFIQWYLLQSPPSELGRPASPCKPSLAPCFDIQQALNLPVAGFR